MLHLSGAMLGLLIFFITMHFMMAIDVTLPTYTVKKSKHIFTYDSRKINSSVPLVLSFGFAQPISNADVSFECNGVSISAKKDRHENWAYYTVQGSSAILTIRRDISVRYIGDCSATASGQRAEVKLRSAVLIHSKDMDIRGTQGDPQRISCNFASADKATVNWFHSSGDSVNDSSWKPLNASLDRFTFGNATLTIKNLEFSDSGYYMCNITNILGQDSAIVDLRVKDRLAALWPFFGILIEVSVLVTAILLYEKYRSKNLKLEVLLDPQAETALTMEDKENASVRHRTINT